MIGSGCRMGAFGLVWILGNPMQSLAGKTIGRYHLLEPLGEGGMATVYKAFDTRLERPVAVKVIRTDFGTDPQFLQRFEREARALARLSHPHIVHVLDAGEQDGAPYLVMEYLAGGTLKALTGRPHPAAEAARLLAPIARALDYAHTQGIVHRDIKPANILLTPEGLPMLSDFGIAKVLASPAATELTATGFGVGTPDYMAPEQWAGHATPQSDVYALGVVLYELVTGRRPYLADTPLAVLLKHVNDPLPAPRQFAPGLAAEVEPVLYKALAKQPTDRYATMGAFAAALEALSHTATIVARRPRWLLPIGLGATALVGCLLVAAAGLLLARWSTSTTPATAVSGQTTPPGTLVATTEASRQPTETAPPATAVPATLAPTPTTLPTVPPTPAGGGGLIAFYSNRSGSNDIYVMNPDGTDVRQLTFDDDDSRLPAWSQDGREIAYQASVDGIMQIMMVNLAGGQIRQVTSDVCNHFNPVVSDSGRIAYYSDCDGNREIYTMRSDGTGVAQLTATTDVYNWFPFWSPDGSRITFSSNRDGKYQIFVMNLDGTDPIPLARGCVSAYSPDGRRIVFSSFCDGSGDILVMDADGGNVRNLTNGIGGNANATWSRDGSRIVFQSDRAGSVDLYAMDPDGRNLTPLTSGVAVDAAPVWQP